MQLHDKGGALISGVRGLIAEWIFEGQRVGLVRDESGVLLLGDGSSHVDAVERGGWAEVPLGEAATLMGGELPAGASEVDVAYHDGARYRARVEDGLWTVLVPRPSLRPWLDIPFCFRDPEGRILPQPVSTGLLQRPVDDATDACPACGAVSWEDLREDRSAPADPHSPVGGAGVWVSCRSCGHSEHGGVMRLTPVGNRQRAYVRKPHITILRQALVSLPFPVYVARAASSKLEWYDYADGKLSTVIFSHSFSGQRGGQSAVRVKTGPEPDPIAEIAMTKAAALVWHLHDGLRQLHDTVDDAKGAMSDAAAVIARSASLRSDAKSALDSSNSIPVIVDGQREDFRYVKAAGAWVACRVGAKPMVTISAVGQPVPLQLVGIDSRTAIAGVYG